MSYAFIDKTTEHYCPNKCTSLFTLKHFLKQNMSQAEATLMDCQMMGSKVNVFLSRDYEIHSSQGRSWQLIYTHDAALLSSIK